MTTDLRKEIDQLVIMAQDIEEERRLANVAAAAAERAAFLEEYAPTMEHLRHATPNWAHAYIEVPSDWDILPIIRLPDLPPIFCRVIQDSEIVVEFDLTIYDKWKECFCSSRCWQASFALAVKAAVTAKQTAADILASQQPVESKPTKWAGLDPTRKALEAIANMTEDDPHHAGAYALLAVARELRCIAVSLRQLVTQLAPRADELDPDQAGSY